MGEQSQVDMRTLPAYEAGREEGLPALVESRGFHAVLDELKDLAEAKGYGTLRYWIKCAADVAKNREHAEADLRRAREEKGGEG